MRWHTNQIHRLNADHSVELSSTPTFLVVYITDIKVFITGGSNNGFSTFPDFLWILFVARALFMCTIDNSSLVWAQRVHLLACNLSDTQHNTRCDNWTTREATQNLLIIIGDNRRSKKYNSTKGLVEPFLAQFLPATFVFCILLWYIH
jgi:hypothetical protein